MDKQTKIEEKRKHFVEVNEMAKDIELAGKCTSFNNGKIDLTLFKTSEEIAETLYHLNYRKIPEGAVVLTREEFKAYAFVKEFFDGKSTTITAGELVRALQLYDKQARKETAEKFAERLKADVSEDNELHEALNAYLKRDYFEYIDEILKEITEAQND